MRGWIQVSCAWVEKAKLKFRRVKLSADVDHRAGGRFEAGFANVVASFFLLDRVFDEGCELGVGGSVA